jgi:hypothetical protein
MRILLSAIKADYSCKPCRYKPWRWRTRDKIIVVTMLTLIALVSCAAITQGSKHTEHRDSTFSGSQGNNTMGGDSCCRGDTL